MTKRAKRHERVVHARRLRREPTEPERKLWWYLRRLTSGGSHFRRQAPTGPYFADFACHERRLIIELDGETHTTAASAARDDVRSNYFRAHGYRVLRFWNGDVMRNIEGVLEVVAAALQEEPPPLTPPHASRGRGKESPSRGSSR